MVAELKEAEDRRKETNLSPEAFAVMWYLERQDIRQAEAVARQAASAFESHPHWQRSSHQEQEVRKALYKSLIDAGVEGVVELATGVMRMLRRASS
jgi:type I restriction enzyme R subunit